MHVYIYEYLLLVTARANKNRYILSKILLIRIVKICYISAPPASVLSTIGNVEMNEQVNVVIYIGACVSMTPTV